ncbi:carboxyl-terminal-processing peptidase 3, chloroplastic isoform X1 [Solanum dulcamara]|uniref:carboxyl-terminal-processing peptidase 3, chloroplastic isoform X1 n=1 Tax=Solanum dulcamara TaxID=45834 RepID=UPI002484E0B4|nr:carboxyl-terminal-processing peptidase 3, chloroplastic isoform X1 [Solanum dulcamara]
METLCSNFDLGSSISKSFTSKSLFSCRFSSIRFRRRVVPQAFGRKELPIAHLKKEEGENENLVKWVGKGVIGLAAALSLSCHSLALAESLTVAFPVSHTPEVNTVQRTLIEAWSLIRETFVDPTFNHQDWDLKLQQTMVEMFPLRSEDAAYSKVRGMLSTLGDPYTRIISPKEYQSFRIGSDGNLQGVGLFVSVEPNTGHLVVLSCVENSPAARAGIHEGDELLEINGERLDGVDSETAAQKLRGRAGTTVTVKVHRGNVAGVSSYQEVKLPREVIKLSPISSAIIPHKMPDGRLLKTGYVKLSSFSQSAAMEMENTIQDMENQGVQSYILDLRNNPASLVTAGLDVAQLWLDGDETLVNTVDRDGNMAPISIVNGHAVTHDPLVVLVNEGSASASEILAGALRDNGRAILVGHKTFGKGKIQSVTQLHDGSALFVTVAKYLSPALHDIDQVGITPDIQCAVDMLNSPKDTFKERNTSSSSLEADFCIIVAEHELDIQESKGSAS